MKLLFINPRCRIAALSLLLISVAVVAAGQDTLSPRHGFTQTTGGRGGRIIRVTTLAKSGEGSFAAALALPEPRIIVFEVGGIIDLGASSLRVDEPFVTVAGQTAPAPGITFIRGGITVWTHDVILQHLRIRPGEAGRPKKSGWEVDGLTTAAGAYDVIVDHCSCTWATDENLSASGPRFAGATAADWRLATSHRITFSNCLLAEGLSHATHALGEHSKGSLIHDNTSDIAILGNLFANNVQRNPLFKGGARGVVVNNLIINPGTKAIHFGLVPSEWTNRLWLEGQMAVVGNDMVGGADTSPRLALMTHLRGPLKLHLHDNQAHDRTGLPLPVYETLAAPGTEGCQLTTQPPTWPQNLKPLPVSQVRAAVLAHVGARPWDRDAIDQRIIEQARAGTGRIINSETEVGGYPGYAATRAPFDPKAWNPETMERLPVQP